MELLAQKPLKKLVITDKTGDLLLEFESEVRLEVFNNSSGYEGWNCGTPSGLDGDWDGRRWDRKLKQSRLFTGRQVGKRG